jgi:hypothetical protein
MKKQSFSLLFNPPPLRHGGGGGGLNLRPIILNKKKPSFLMDFSLHTVRAGS